ncbi:MAG: glycosyltransferase [Candidatus Omnitrophota bacterium]
MKVAYLLGQFPVLSEIFIVDEVLQLQKMGIEVSIFAFDKPGNKLVHKEAQGLSAKARYACNPKAGWHALGAVFFANLFFFLRAPIIYSSYFRKYFFKIGKKEFLQIFYICRHIKKEKVTHLYAHFACLSTTAAMIASRLLNIPFSFAVHGYDIFVVNDFLKEKLEAATYVVVGTHYIKSFLLEKYPHINPAKIAIIRYGIDTTRYQPKVSSQKSTHQGVRLLSGARFVEKKGFMYLIRACKYLKEKGLNFHCDIFGYGPLEKQLYDETAKLKLQDVIAFLGAIDSDGLIRLLQENDIFVVPSIIAGDGDREGMPITLLSAMAAQNAVVSTETSGIPEVVVSGENGILVKEKDVQGLAGALERLIMSETLRLTLAGRARRTITESFSLTEHARLLAALWSAPQQKIFKILYVNKTASIGGAEVSLLNLIKQLDRKIFFPVVVVPGHGPFTHALAAMGVTVKNLAVSEFSRRRVLSFFLATMKLSRFIRQEKIDLVHVNSIYAAEQSFFASQWAKVACVCHIRDLVPVLGGGAMRINAFKKAEKLIAISEAVKKDLIAQLEIPEEKIIRIYNGVDTKEFNPEIRADIFKKEFHLEGKRLIGMVARFVPEKGQELFLRVAQAVSKVHPEAHFIIAGDAALGKEAYRKKMMELIVTLGLESKVTCTGFRTDMPYMIAALDIVAVPSWAEPFGRVIIEAFACGKPVVAFKAGASEEIISANCGILVSPGDIAVFSEAIRYLLENESVRKQLGEQARAMVVQRFNIESNIKTTQELYQKILQ